MPRSVAPLSRTVKQKRRQLTSEQWEEIKAELLAISQQGRQDVDLAEFIARDRETH